MKTLPVRLCLATCACNLLVRVDGFVVAPTRATFGRLEPLRSETKPAAQKETQDRKETQTLGLLTFDLDDTLYPTAPVAAEANEAFVKAMASYGFQGLERDQIIQTSKQIREEIGEVDPEKAAILTHNEIRELAIRREMEKVILERKLQSCADDWATPVEDLADVVVASAKKWAKEAVSESMVKAVMTAWEMERHHASERHLYPEVLDALKRIKEEHPTAIIGAVTDGLANPLFMTFTLAPYFDFSCSWEDDQGGRQKFFKELEKTGGESAELTWIYDEARYKYAVLKQAQDGMAASGNGDVPALVFPDTYDDRVWIHVGDDLAFDVGGSAACGAKTIYAELADKYGQTARHRFNDKPQPSWSSTSSKELEKRFLMCEAAKDKVDVRMNFLTRLPDAINEILEKS